MSTKAERQATLADIRQILGEALVAHSISDDRSHELLLDLELDDEQQRIDKLYDEDPIRAIWFDNDQQS
jgi:hypothetical protein